MGLKEAIKPITYMKTNAADILTQVSESRRPIIIKHNGEGKMVIQCDSSSWIQVGARNHAELSTAK